MGRKTPPFDHHPQWTTSRFWTFIRSALRQAWNKYPVKYEALKRAEVGKKINTKTGRLAKHYECNKCKKHFPAKEVQVDHIVDVGSLKCHADLIVFVTNLFCGIDDLQILCKPCHKSKSINT